MVDKVNGDQFFQERGLRTWSDLNWFRKACCYTTLITESFLGTLIFLVFVVVVNGWFSYLFFNDAPLMFITNLIGIIFLFIGIGLLGEFAQDLSKNTFDLLSSKAEKESCFLQFMKKEKNTNNYKANLRYVYNTHRDDTVVKMYDRIIVTFEKPILKKLTQVKLFLEIDIDDIERIQREEDLNGKWSALQMIEDYFYMERL